MPRDDGDDSREPMRFFFVEEDDEEEEGAAVDRGEETGEDFCVDAEGAPSSEGFLEEEDAVVGAGCGLDFDFARFTFDDNAAVLFVGDRCECRRPTPTPMPTPTLMPTPTPRNEDADVDVGADVVGTFDGQSEAVSLTPTDDVVAARES